MCRKLLGETTRCAYKMCSPFLAVFFTICGIYYLVHEELWFHNSYGQISTEHFHNYISANNESLINISVYSENEESLIKDDIPILYKGKIELTPGSTFGDEVFTNVHFDALMFERHAKIYSVVEQVPDCREVKKKLRCLYDEQIFDIQMICIYSYKKEFVSTPRPCSDHGQWEISESELEAKNLANRKVICHGNTPSMPAYINVYKDSDFNFKSLCMNLDDIKFQSPCITTKSCYGNRRDAQKYNVGLFEVEDAYILREYSILKPKSILHKFSKQQKDDGKYFICDEVCDQSEHSCTEMYSTSSSSTKEEVCTRAKDENWMLGDQKVNWTIYPGEIISVCTFQKYNKTKENNFSLHRNVPKEKKDIVTKETLTEEECLEILESAGGIRYVLARVFSFVLLSLSCVCSWAAFASYFDRYTNTFSVFWRHDGRDHIPACVYDFSEHSNTEKASLIYCFCGWMGSMVGCGWFLFIWGIVWMCNDGTLDDQVYIVFFINLFSLCMAFALCGVCCYTIQTNVVQNEQELQDYFLGTAYEQNESRMRRPGHIVVL